MTSRYAMSALTTDQTHLLDACVVETDFASTARAHDGAVAKAVTLWEKAKATLAPDHEAAEAIAYQQSQVADIIKRLMWVKWPEASQAWFNRTSVEG